MALAIIIAASFVKDSIQYVTNDVIDLPAATITWLTGLDPAQARPIANGPAPWEDGNYAINNLVTHLDAYWVNDEAVTTGQTPGTDAEWVAVRYLPNTPGEPPSEGGGDLTGNWINARIQDNYLEVKDINDGSWTKPWGVKTEGNPAVTATS